MAKGHVPPNLLLYAGYIYKGAPLPSIDYTHNKNALLYILIKYILYLFLLKSIIKYIYFFFIN